MIKTRLFEHLCIGQNKVINPVPWYKRNISRIYAVFQWESMCSFHPNLYSGGLQSSKCELYIYTKEVAAYSKTCCILHEIMRLCFMGHLRDFLYLVKRGSYLVITLHYLRPPHFDNSFCTGRESLISFRIYNFEFGISNWMSTWAKNLQRSNLSVNHTCTKSHSSCSSHWRFDTRS